MCAVVGSKGNSCQFRLDLTKAKDGKRKGGMNGQALRKKIRQGLVVGSIWEEKGEKRVQQ